MPPRGTPPVIIWFKLYTGFLTLVYFALTVLSLVFFTVDPALLDASPSEAKIIGLALLVIGGILFGVCLLPLIVQPRPWVWVYDLVVICLGMTSACFLPICIPLLIFWLKSDTKRYFNSEPNDPFA